MSASVGSSSDGGVSAAMDSANASYEAETVEDIGKESLFSKVQGEASIGNTAAKANPTS